MINPLVPGILLISLCTTLVLFIFFYFSKLIKRLTFTRFLAMTVVGAVIFLILASLFDDPAILILNFLGFDYYMKLTGILFLNMMLVAWFFVQKTEIMPWLYTFLCAIYLVTLSALLYVLLGFFVLDMRSTHNMTPQPAISLFVYTETIHIHRA